MTLVMYSPKSIGIRICRLSCFTPASSSSSPLLLRHVSKQPRASFKVEQKLQEQNECELSIGDSECAIMSL